MKLYSLFINNEFTPSAEMGQAFDVINPATGAVFARISHASKAEAMASVESAKTAQRAWRKLSGPERAQYLHRLADALIDQAEAIGAVLAQESGKSLEDASNEARYAAEITRYHAEWGRRIEGEIIPSDGQNENLLLMREPIGVVACLIPFNYPVYTLLRKIAPALITGNTVIVRPSNNTPCSAFIIAKAVQQAGLPAGVINILTMSHEVAEAVCTHPHVGMLTLTGSVGAGRKMLEYSQVNIAKVSLELGGKTPVIIAPDANLAEAVKQIAASKLTHCGQLCTAAERVYVPEALYDECVALLKAEFAKVSIGDRAENATNMGPLVNANAQLNTQQMVERAIDSGAKLEIGGYLPEGKGFFYPPTLLSNCKQHMEIVQEETFAPVLAVLKYQTLDEALALANDHQFGLASVLFSDNYQTVMTFANQIEAGELYVNRTPADPYQGYHAGWKRSGLGGDDGKHGMLEFTQTRLVVLKHHGV